MRIKFISLALVFIFLLLVLELINLGIIQGKKYRELSEKNCLRILPQLGSRGNIFDRQGNLIVGNLVSYDVTVLPSEVGELDKILSAAARILELSPEELKSRFKEHYLAPTVAVTLSRNIEIKKAMAIEELKSDLSGLNIEPRPVRNYPRGRLASHVIGYLNEIDRWRLENLADYGYKARDIVGFGGVEESYDYYLRQLDGGLSVEVDRKGRIVRVLGYKPPQAGKDIQLTIDLKIQRIAEDALAGRKGCVIIIDPDNGEVITLASNPGFDPSVFVKKSTSGIRSLFNNPEAPLYNRAISGTYPAGSLFKLIVATAALETGKINLSTNFLCPGSINIGKQQFLCWDTHGEQNLFAAIAHSCNIFFYRTGLLVGAPTLHDYALKFGLAKPTGIDLTAEAGGFIPSPLWKKIYRFKKWFDGDTVNLSIGQGELLVTPLQMARVMAVFANKGKLVTPHIIKSIDGQNVPSAMSRIITLAFKEGTLDYIRKGLRDAVQSSDGTASVLSALSVSVAGKTGTAQVSGKQPHGWFIGFFPFKKPKFVICVFLEHGGSGYNAGLLVKQIIEAMLQGGLI